MHRVTRLTFAALATLVVGCTDYESRTDLNPDGPPMVRQVRMWERYVDQFGTERSRRVFAFGTHEQADESELAINRPEGMVTTADAIAPLRGANPDSPTPGLYGFRIIMDELLVGNNLEEIACRGLVDSDALTRVPLGATPEDIARCAGPDDTLPEACPASNPKSVCICELDSGCPVGTKIIEKGQPVGVSDLDQDGAADETRMIDGAVQIKCGSGGSINVPLNLDLSYWNPSGDQNKPAAGGFDALGPAIVLTPERALPTNVECQLGFGEEIVDKTNEKVCAPPGGNIAMSCTPGDMSNFKFRVEPMKINGATVSEGQMGVTRNIGMGGTPIDFIVNVPPDAASLSAVSITPAVANATITITGPDMNTIRISGPAGTTLAANTMYTVTITTALTDTYSQAMPQQYVIHFTSGT